MSSISVILLGVKRKYDSLSLSLSLCLSLSLSFYLSQTQTHTYTHQIHIGQNTCPREIGKIHEKVVFELKLRYWERDKSLMGEDVLSHRNSTYIQKLWSRK
jgi:hypothetical protein